MPAPISDRDGRLRRLRNLIAAAVLVWTALVGSSLAWNIHNLHQQTHELARREALVHYEKDQSFRLWAARHGGVYVPVDERTPPNANLESVERRDVRLEGGTTLTLMNPAYMIRQLIEESVNSYGVRSRITSLHPIHPGNAPDPWEASALRRLGAGAAEILEIERGVEGDVLRLMRPMVVEGSCLKCHSEQGYKVGDVRGGLGVSVPLKPYHDLAERSERVQAATHGGIWFAGLAGLVGMGWRARRQTLDEAAEEERIRLLGHERQLILNAAADGIVGLGPDGLTTFANRAALALLGTDEGALLGKDFHALVHDGVDDAECPIQIALKSGQVQSSIGEPFRRADGTVLPVEVTAAPIDDFGVTKGVVMLFRDISERLEHERQNRKLMQRLTRSNEDLQHFAYVVSHDLQEPLRMVSSYLTLIERRYGQALDQDGHEFIGYAVDGARRMSRMIADLLEFSRVETRGEGFGAVGMAEVVAEAVSNLEVSITEAGARVTVDGDLPVVVGDGSQLVRVFQNLIANAVKFRHPDRAPAVEVSARREADGAWRFTVRDNGIGVAEVGRERIFQIFQRLHPRDRYDGTGIGLAVVKRIVERHNGRIWVEPVPEGGSAFHFTLGEGAEE